MSPREGQQGRETDCVPGMPQPVPCIRGRVRVTVSWGRGARGAGWGGAGNPRPDLLGQPGAAVSG